MCIMFFHQGAQHPASCYPTQEKRPNWEVQYEYAERGRKISDSGELPGACADVCVVLSQRSIYDRI
jgi:hypothetical protein